MQHLKGYDEIQELDTLGFVAFEPNAQDMSKFQKWLADDTEASYLAHANYPYKGVYRFDLRSIYTNLPGYVGQGKIDGIEHGYDFNIHFGKNKVAVELKEFSNVLSNEYYAKWWYIADIEDAKTYVKEYVDLWASSHTPFNYITSLYQTEPEKAESLEKEYQEKIFPNVTKLKKILDKTPRKDDSWSYGSDPESIGSQL